MFLVKGEQKKSCFTAILLKIWWPILPFKNLTLKFSRVFTGKKRGEHLNRLANILKINVCSCLTRKKNVNVKYTQEAVSKYAFSHQSFTPKNKECRLVSISELKWASHRNEFPCFIFSVNHLTILCPSFLWGNSLNLTWLFKKLLHCVQNTFGICEFTKCS